MAIAAAPVLAAACATSIPVSTPTPTSPPPPTATPLPTPTPTPSAADHLAVGQAAAFNGDWDSALSAFDRAAAGDGAAARQAGLQRALVLYDSGRLDEARTALDFFLIAHPEGREAAQAHLIRGLARRDLGDAAGAVEDLDAYLALRPGQIDAYVLEWAGDTLWNAGQPRAAADRYLASAGYARLGADHGVRFKAGRALLEADDPSGAIQIFNAIYQATADPDVRAAANWYAGQALEAQGEQGAAYARYLESVNNFPEAQETYLALVELVNADVPVNDFQRGLIDLNVGVYGPAAAAFDRVIASQPSSRAYFLRAQARRGAGNPAGALADLTQVTTGFADAPERTDAWLLAAEIAWFDLGDPRQAIAIYQQFVASDSGNPKAPEALYSAGRASELNGDLPGSASLYISVADGYPSSALASGAAFRAGLAQYRLGDLAGSTLLFRRAGDLAQSGEDRAAAAFWAGKALSEQGNPEEARLAWSSAAASDPTGFYAERAADVLAGRRPFDSAGLFEFPADLGPERARAEDWLRSSFAIVGQDPLSEIGASLAADPRVARGRELLDLGLYDQARPEFESLRTDYSGDAEATYRLMHLYLDLGLYDLAIRASRQVLDLAGFDDAGTFTGPRYFNLIRFGPYFGDLILPEALDRDLDGLFLFSVVRQESLFQGAATSSASARGLMQVIPSTGAQIAAELGWPPGYTEADLHRPIVSVRFGTYYLARQRDSFGGDLLTALAAYNGGPGNAAVWVERAGGDPDLLVEVIGFQETRTYLRTIYEVFNIYRALYVPEG